MRVTVLRSSGAIGLAAGALLAATIAPAAAATSGPGTGSAYGASATVSVLPGVLGAQGLTVDTGRLAASSTSGPGSASVVDAPLKGLVTAKAITSSANHSESSGQVRATASIVDAALPVLAPIAGRTPTAQAITAKCTSTADGVTGSSELAGLDLGRLGKLPVSTGPNREVGVPGVVRVIVNEQVRHADGSLTVNALHIELLGGKATAGLGSGDIVLASATCAAATTPPSTPATPAPGGGQVSVIPAGAPQTGDGSLATVIED
ncbi:choice-of-anchor P family protein [Amycolatopsis acidiphila]|uniref:Secreted protein n=1 Tax=Amycolatopsis acidiphila TaxID=715473 RepID=A0A558ACU2_9PSEU|nr:choice-of-anchor P family protein [Amycolatopsis acidiphila]TVT22065.1 hypothetical protein FNH06_15025 [Amycolatopsis acidiphila]UIJ63614.1 choice-of-anchor P family protein [Amycolatopsis acidiphila]GHG67921.1 hypothetical protein GCM10017788_27180 [Amycolatopsis acidiphila]